MAALPSVSLTACLACRAGTPDALYIVCATGCQGALYVPAVLLCCSQSLTAGFACSIVIMANLLTAGCTCCLMASANEPAARQIVF